MQRAVRKKGKEENILANCTSAKGLPLRMDKQTNSKKQAIYILKWARDLSRHFKTVDMQMSSRFMKSTTHIEEFMSNLQ